MARVSGVMTFSASQAIRPDSYVVLDTMGTWPVQEPNQKFRDVEPEKHRTRSSTHPTAPAGARQPETLVSGFMTSLPIGRFDPTCAPSWLRTATEAAHTEAEISRRGARSLDLCAESIVDIYRHGCTIQS